MKISCFCLLLLANLAHAQLRCTVVKVGESQRDPNQDNVWITDTQLKITAGTLTPELRDLEFMLPNGDKAYVRSELFDVLKTGQTGQAILTTYNGEPKVGTVLVPRGSFAVKPPASRSFEGVINQAFLGNEKNDYNVVLSSFKGHLLPGDVLQAVGPEGQRCQATVQSIDRRGSTVDMLTAAMTDVLVIVKSANCVLNTNYRLSLSGAKTMVAEAKPEPAKTAVFAGKRTVFPVNTVLKTNDLRIVVNNVIQYFPVEGMLVKVDPDLAYYVLDVTLENTTSQVVDAGDYTLRLNFFDGSGTSADEFSRVFKNEKNKPDDARRGADVLDKEVFGGSGALRYATVLVAYQNDLPSYDKSAYDLAWGKLQPGQKVRCESLKMIGVPKAYRPTAIGTWRDNRRNLTTAPISLK